MEGRRLPGQPGRPGTMELMLRKRWLRSDDALDRDNWRLLFQGRPLTPVDWDNGGNDDHVEKILITILKVV